MITVVSFREGNRWFVQGVNIDFCATGGSLDEAMVRFWAGLAMSFWKTQLEKGNVESVMRPPSQQVIDRLESLLGRPIPTILESAHVLQ